VWQRRKFLPVRGTKEYLSLLVGLADKAIGLLHLVLDEVSGDEDHALVRV
jgi:hypothetical protein